MEESIIDFNTTTSPTTHKSKAERLEDRKLHNTVWKIRTYTDTHTFDPNKRHTAYYAIQLPDISSEWIQLKEFMSRDLPVTFRLCVTRSPLAALCITHKLNKEFRRMRGRFTSVKGQVIDEVVVPVEWCVNAWQVNADSSTLAKDPGFSSLYYFLCREVRLCHVVRQELVSMIPAILLDPQPHHYVLDMCAAPGSKTEQLISALYPTNLTDSYSGLVVANDADPKRLATLRKRYRNCTAPNLMFTCATAANLESHLHGRFSFDRIICDVPCTGDGTFRKSPHLWRLFRPRFAVELHPLQLEIARSGLRLLHVGGRLVYSTCSLNPIEDEAVVAALLTGAWREGLNLQLVAPEDLMTGESGAVPLLDSRLPGMRYRPGVSFWRCDEETLLAGETDPAELEESRQRLPPVTASMYPPSDPSLLGLERCMRFVPQDMNTGGFFVAVLELRKPDTMSRTVESDKCSSRKRKILCEAEKEVDVTRNKRSMQAFRELGYNPHQDSTCSTDSKRKTDLKKLQRWRIDSGAADYRDVLNTAEGSDVCADIENICGICLSQQSQYRVMLATPFETESLKEKKRSRRDVSEPKFEDVVVMSANVAAAVQNWGSGGDILVQAGVVVSSRVKMDERQRRSANENFRLDGINGGIILKYFGGRVVQISSIVMSRIIHTLMKFKEELSEPEEMCEIALPVIDVVGDENAERELLECIPGLSYALLEAKMKLPTDLSDHPLGSKSCTSFPMSSTDEPTRKRRLSKAERKKLNNRKLNQKAERLGDTGDIQYESKNQSVVINEEFRLELLIRKDYNSDDELIVICSRDIIESYAMCLGNSSPSGSL